MLKLGSGKKPRHCRAPNSKVGLGPRGEKTIAGVNGKVLDECRTVDWTLQRELE